MPALALKDGEPHLAFGVMGAAFQPMGHVYVLSNMLDYGLDAQAALDHPRVFIEGGVMQVEAGLPAAVATRLIDMGHTLERRRAPWGGGQIVAIDRDNGVLAGASDHRKDGCALGY